MNPDGTKSIIFDTDIGSDIDDAYALAFILSCHELRLEAVTVVSGDVHQRAQIAARRPGPRVLSMNRTRGPGRNCWWRSSARGPAKSRWCRWDR